MKQKTLKISLFIFLILPVFLFAQQKKIDSLKTLVTKTKEPTEKLELLTHLSKLIDYNGDDKKEEVHFFNEMLQLATALKNYKKQHIALKHLANYYLKAGDFNKAQHFATQSKAICTAHNLQVECMFTYSLLGRIYNHFDDYNKAITNYKISIKTYNTLSKKDQKSYLNFKSTLYANLGVVYKNNHNDSLADLYNIKSFELAEKLKDYMRISHFYTTQGWTYVSIENYEKAVKYFILALKDSAKVRIKIYNIAAHHGLGHAYSEWGKYKQAIHHDMIALNYFKKTKNTLFTSTLYNNLSIVYLRLQQYKTAQDYALQALTLAQSIQAKKNIASAKLTLSQIYIKQKKIKKAKSYLKAYLDNEALFSSLVWRQKIKLFQRLSVIENNNKNYKQALDYNLRYLQYTDSIHKRILYNFSDLDAKYQNEKKRKEIIVKDQELELQKVKSQKLFIFNLLLAIISLLFIVFFSYYYIRAKRTKEELSKTIKEIQKIKEELFQTKQLHTNTELANSKKAFKQFLMQKYRIEKNEIIDVWESIANGISRKEYAKLTRINENTIKSWRNELYSALKKATFTTTRYSDYKAVVAYYETLRMYETILLMKKTNKYFTHVGKKQR